MIRANQNMRALLAACGVDPAAVAPAETDAIWQKTDAAGRAYWGVSHFWNQDRNGVPETEDLTMLEWAGNEVHLDALNAKAAPAILTQTIGIMKAWQQMLETLAPQTPFIIFANYDDGSLLDPEDIPDGFASTFLRFWADRNDGTAPVDVSNFEQWQEPAMFLRCNDPAQAPA